MSDKQPQQSADGGLPYTDYTQLYLDPIGRPAGVGRRAAAHADEAASWPDVDYTKLYVDPVARQANISRRKAAAEPSPQRAAPQHVHTSVEEAPGGGVAIRVFFRRGSDVRSVRIVVDFDDADEPADTGELRGVAVTDAIPL